MNQEAIQTAGTEPQYSAAELTKYFKSTAIKREVAVLPIMSGVILVISGFILGTLCVNGAGGLLIIVGVILLLIERSQSKITDQDYDRWVGRQAQQLIIQACTKLGLDASNHNEQPLQIQGFLLQGMDEATSYRPDELLWRTGREGIPRYAVNRYCFLFALEEQLVAYVGDVSAINQSVQNEHTYEYAYSNIADLEINDVLAHLIVQGAARSYRVQRFVVQATGSENISIAIGAEPLENKHLPDFSREDNDPALVVEQLRTLLP